MSHWTIILGAMICLANPTLAERATSQSPVARITIKSRHMSTAIDPEANITIEAKGRTFSSGHHRVAPEAVAALVSAIDEEELVAPRLANLGITEAWLKSELTSQASAIPFSLQQDQRFAQSFCDSANIERVLPELYRFDATDDHGKVDAVVAFGDRTEVTISSSSHYEFMLPWTIVRNGVSTKTYNANISRAIASFLPKRAANRARLNGLYLSLYLAEIVASDLRRPPH